MRMHKIQYNTMNMSCSSSVIFLRIEWTYTICYQNQFSVSKWAWLTQGLLLHRREKERELSSFRTMWE